MNSSKPSDRLDASNSARTSALFSAGVMFSIEDLYQSTHPAECGASSSLLPHSGLQSVVARRHGECGAASSALYPPGGRVPGTSTRDTPVGAISEAASTEDSGLSDTEDMWRTNAREASYHIDTPSDYPADCMELSADQPPLAGTIPPILLSTASVTALIWLSVLLVVFTGFLPIYIIGYHEVNGAFDVLQSQATSGMITASCTPIRQLSNLAAFVLAKYSISTVGNTSELPQDSGQVLRSLSSVISRHRNVVQRLSFTKAGPKGSWMSQTAFFRDGSLSVALEEATYNSSVSMLAGNPQTLILTKEPLTDFYSNQTLGSLLNSPISVYQNVVVPLNNSLREGFTDYPKLFSAHFDRDRKDEIFDFMIPLGSPDSNQLTFLEAVISSSVMRGGYKNFTDVLRANGRYFIVEPTGGQVIINSWNQSYLESAEEGRYGIPFQSEEIADPLALAAMQHLRKRDAFAVENGGTRLHRFRFHGTWASVRSHHLKIPSGLQMVFVVVTLPSDYLSSMYTARTVLLAVTIFVVFAMTLAAYWVASYVVSALNQLIPALEATYNLQFGELATPQGNSPRVTELLYIQLAYHQLQQQLFAIKTFVPGPLLIQSSEVVPGPGASDNDPERAPTTEEKSMQVGQQPISEYARISRKWRQDLRLNTKMFNEQVNVFQPRYCSLVWVCRYYTNDVNYFSLGDFFAVAYATTIEYNGCLEFLRPDYVVISFGAHTPMTMHANRACQCALALLSHLSPRDREQVTVLVDSNEYLVGTCGAANGEKGRVVFDTMHLLNLTCLIRAKKYNSVIATQSTVTYLPDYQSIPIDCVRTEGNKIPFVLCELCEPPPGADIDAISRTAKRFRAAFHYMTKGKYHHALRTYEAIGCGNPTAARLIAVCQENIRNHKTTPFITYFSYPPMHIISQFLTSKNVCTFMKMERAYMLQLLDGDFQAGRIPPNKMINISHKSKVRLGTGGEVSPPEKDPEIREPSVAVDHPPTPQGEASNCRDPRTQRAANKAPPMNLSEHHSEATGAELAATSMKANDDNDTALFDLIDVESSSDSDLVSLTPQPMNGSSMLLDPIIIVDDCNVAWTRSVKKISDGAFSVVYLGMSEDGVQVAIKCIPRRRRDIREEDVKTEMRTMARLRHPNIVQYISCSVTVTHLAIIMEYVPGGSLYAVIRNCGRMQFTIVRRFLMDILSGLVYLHARGIVHCDVKPHNVLLGVDGACKLSDFGSTITEATDMARTTADDVFLRGTALYMAPEVARGVRCTPQSDVYSLGISMLEMLLGVLPWRWTGSAPPGSTPESLQMLFRSDARFVRSLGRGEVEPEIPDTLDREVLSFVRACCQVDPSKRPSAQELLSFPFLL